MDNNIGFFIDMLYRPDSEEIKQIASILNKTSTLAPIVFAFSQLYYDL